MKVDAIIVAAGSGQRLGYREPKAFVKLHSEPILFYSFYKFEQSDFINNIIVVIPRESLAQTNSLIKDKGFTKVKAVVPGGTERKDSVQNGLYHVSADADAVLIHDAARPFVSLDVIAGVVNEMAHYKVVIPVVPVTDTVKSIDPETTEVEKTLDRDRLVCVQTPQGFSADVLPLLIEKMSTGMSVFDEAMLLENEFKVATVPGTFDNFKITYPFDLKRADLLLNEKNI